ncbi:MAG: hypothetical protein ABSG45_00825 [Nitrososphaerales archaeon]|jgi:hypothetical protein
MSKMYTVFGYNSTPTSPELKSRNEGFLAFFEPTTTNPREAAERAISIHCGNISIYFTGGENHFEKVVKLVENEVAWRRSAWGNLAPIVPEGEETTWTILGSAHPLDSKGKLVYRRILTNDNSTTPGDDINHAIELGATEIRLEVKQWKHGNEEVTSSSSTE